MEWIKSHKKWIVVVLVALGALGEYVTGAIGVEEAIKRVTTAAQEAQQPAETVQPSSQPQPQTQTQTQLQPPTGVTEPKPTEK